MNYLSLGFCTFVFATWITYNIVKRKIRWYILLEASILFYLMFDIKYIFFLLVVSVSTFICAITFNNVEYKKLSFITCIIFNVGVWFIIKGLPWVSFSINRVLNHFGVQIDDTFSAWIIPIGISYYVLQAIGYLTDVYKGEIEAEKNYGKYLLFLVYFPAIVQGPISRYKQLSKQLTNGKKIDFQCFRESLLLTAFGLIKKMVIADNLAIIVNECFINYPEMKGIVLYFGAVCYAFQLYMDFSGCVDICRGVSALFGIDLVDNFNAPYFSKSIKEFWRRWHMSLSSWLKDYVYIPLGGSRKGVVRKYMNLAITFAVSGIWHGAGLNYLIWGLLQAIYQIVGECTLGIRHKIKTIMNIKENSVSDNFYRRCITFNLSVVSWIVFRAGSLKGAISYLKNMCTLDRIWALTDGSLFEFGITYNKFIVILINILVVLVFEYYSMKENRNTKNVILNMHLITRWIIYLVLVFDVLLFGAYGSGYNASGFLYGGF